VSSYLLKIVAVIDVHYTQQGFHQRHDQMDFGIGGK
jgi:hypothetical protein